ncbi:SRPBCC family protein [Kribbella pittospori]|uniref:SRPBCC family protein n=1 Tax=Kribbella pittospori TaxID=722689 RepID=A0A4R0K552_9ACTN|nr:SRPBCC family protein [Kribbella pittospori]TCC54490.1 SRPBCC family protein [Kribbella pittospori]
MNHHEAWTTVDVAPNILFDRLSDLERLPDFLPWMTALHRTEPPPAESQGPEARLPKQPVHQEVDVAATDPAAGEGEFHREAWIDVVDEDRILRWGAPGPHDYQGELLVDFVADGTSKLTVRLDTAHSGDIDSALERTLATIKTSLEQEQGSVGESEA